MSQDILKKQAAEAAIAFVKPGMTVGVGTGSTVRYFIEALADMKHDIEASVSSSEASTKLLKEFGIPVIELNSAGTLPLYVDGADEADEHKRLIKGGGGALTREKVIAAASEQFVCIIDETKQVDVLGRFPLPVEVIPMARSYVAREMVKLGGQPELREGFTTDNGNVILDVYNLRIVDPIDVESKVNQIPGVVTVGLFAARRADKIIVAQENGSVTVL